MPAAVRVQVFERTRFAWLHNPGKPWCRAGEPNA